MSTKDVNTPTLAVGMPVFNAGRWLNQAAQSLLGQTFQDFTLLISDNASTDETPDICRELVRMDPRVRYFQNSANIGVFRNYDRVFSYSETKYFKWGSANDLCAPTFLERCVAALEEHPQVVLAYPSTIVFSDEADSGEKYPFDPDVRDADPFERFRRVLTEIRLNNAFNGVFRAEALHASQLNKVYKGSDIVLLAELALRGQIMRLPEYLFYRRMSPDAATARKDEIGLREFFAAEGKDVFGTPSWDFHSHLLKVTLAAPLPLSWRLRAAAFVARRVWWDRLELWREAKYRLSGPTPG